MKCSKAKVIAMACALSTLLTGCGFPQFVMGVRLYKDLTEVIDAQIAILVPSPEEVERISKIFRPEGSTGINPDAKMVAEGTNDEFAGYMKYEYPASHMEFNRAETNNTNDTVHVYNYIDGISKISVKAETVPITENYTYDTSRARQKKKFGEIKRTDYIDINGRSWARNSFMNDTDGYKIITWEYIPVDSRDSYYIEAKMIDSSVTNTLDDVAEFMISSMDLYKEEAELEEKRIAEAAEEDTSEEGAEEIVEEGSEKPDTADAAYEDADVSTDIKDFEFYLNGFNYKLPCTVADLGKASIAFKTSGVTLKLNAPVELDSSNKKYPVKITAVASGGKSEALSGWNVKRIDINMLERLEAGDKTMPFQGIRGITWGSVWSDLKNKMGTDDCYYSEEKDGTQKITYKVGTKGYEQFYIHPVHGLYRAVIGVDVNPE